MGIVTGSIGILWKIRKANVNQIDRKVDYKKLLWYTD